MASWHSSFAPVWVAVVSAISFAMVGCAEPESIRSVDEPKPTRPLPPELPAEQKKFRTLAAMLPQNAGHGADAYGQWWFFKFSGPVEVVSANEPAFHALVQSAQLSQGESPLIWDNPPGWVSGDKVEGRYATLKLGGNNSSTEITVNSAGGSVLMNVNRWRAQLGLEEVSASALESVIAVRSVNQRVVVFVDVTGPKAPPTGPAGPMLKKR